MKEIKAIIQPFMFDQVCGALRKIPELPGMTVSQVIGWGKARAVQAKDTVQEAGCTFARKTKIEIVVSSALADQVVATIASAGRTGNVGDGKIFVHELSEVVKIRTGETGDTAI